MVNATFLELHNLNNAKKFDEIYWRTIQQGSKFINHCPLEKSENMSGDKAFLTLHEPRCCNGERWSSMPIDIQTDAKKQIWIFRTLIHVFDNNQLDITEKWKKLRPVVEIVNEKLNVFGIFRFLWIRRLSLILAITVVYDVSPWKTYLFWFSILGFSTKWWLPLSFRDRDHKQKMAHHWAQKLSMALSNALITKNSPLQLSPFG